MEKIKAIICDLDGTLCNIEHRIHYLKGVQKKWNKFHGALVDDEPNEMVMRVVMGLCMSHQIFFLTGRPEDYRQKTVDWLSKHYQAKDYRLLMRRRSDFRPDYVYKKEAYYADIEPNCDVKLVLEDRTHISKMWREMGLECWQVANDDI